MEIYRTATEADLDILVMMNQQLIEDEKDTLTLTNEEGRKNFQQWLQDPKYQVIVACHDQEIVAYAACRDDSEFTYLRHFFVARSARRQGVGRRFIAQLSQQITPNKPIRLNVLHQNPDAVAFYKACGFRVYGFTPTTKILQKRYGT